MRICVRDDPLPHSLQRVVADVHLSTCDHLDVETLSVHHHERAKRLAVFAKSSEHAFSQREAARPADLREGGWKEGRDPPSLQGKVGGRAGTPAHAPDNLAYKTEAQVLNSVLDGHEHPEQHRKGKLNTHWSDGVAKFLKSFLYSDIKAR